MRQWDENFLALNYINQFICEECCFIRLLEWSWFLESLPNVSSACRVTLYPIRELRRSIGYYQQNPNLINKTLLHFIREQGMK